MALKVGSCSSSIPRWRGLLSILLLLTTFTSHFCAESYSNYINIDDDEDSTSTTTTLASSIGVLSNTKTTASAEQAALLNITSLLSHSSIRFTSPAPQLQSFVDSASNDEDEDVTDLSFSFSSTTLSAPTSTILPQNFFSSSLSPFLSSMSSSSSSEQHQHSSNSNSLSGSEANEIPYQYKFAHSLYNVTIPENSVQKTFVIQPYSDKDRMGIQLYEKNNNSNNNHNDDEMKRLHHVDVKYQIIGGDKNKIFKAEERIVGDFAFLTIRTRTNNIVLNREKGDNYRLRIKATITRNSRIGTKKRTIQEAETLVDVKVLDKNDLSPLFYPTKYSITITDDTPLHQSILRVTAEDADVGINGGKIYMQICTLYIYFSITILVL